MFQDRFSIHAPEFLLSQILEGVRPLYSARGISASLSTVYVMIFVPIDNILLTFRIMALSLETDDLACNDIGKLLVSL